MMFSQVFQVRPHVSATIAARRRVILALTATSVLLMTVLAIDGGALE
jgi:hypothetical protein